MDFVFDKEYWKQDAFARIKNQLYFSKDNWIAGNYSNAKEDHLVVIYGITQVGKTTLILNMIGIQESYFNEVYDALRAAQPKGGSSTSTAIIYSRSDSDKYRLAFRKINSVAASNREEFDRNGLIERLKSIRKDVENGRLDSHYILDISIPQKYFESDAKDYSISILDLPGDNSKNSEEMIHVSKLLTRYIPIASTCIIAARSGYVQQLESLELPNKVSWKDMNHRFVLVISRAYSDADTKSFFKKNKSHCKEDFYEYVQNYYEASIRKILGEGNKTEVYPIDLGESLSSLCTNDGLTNEEISAIYYAKNTALKKLRESISSREGGRLQAALQDLKVVINANFSAISSQLKKAICEQEAKSSRLEKQIEKNRILIQGLETQKAEDMNKPEIIEAAKNLYFLKNATVALDVDSWWKDIDDHYIESGWYSWGKNPHLKGGRPKKDACNYLYTSVNNQVDDYIKMELGSLINRNSADNVIEEHRLRMQTDLFHVEAFFCDYITKEKLIACINELAQLISESIQESIRTTISDLNKVLKKEKDKEKYWDNLIRIRRKCIAENDEGIAECNRKIKELNAELSKMENKMQEDVSTLDEYLRIAREAYLDYRNKMISRLNSRSTSPGEKTRLMLEVGVLDKDYLKIIGGTGH